MGSIEDLIFREDSSKRETRKIIALNALLNEEYTIRGQFIIKFKNGFIQEPIYISTKVGVCYSITMDEYRDALKQIEEEKKK